MITSRPWWRVPGLCVGECGTHVDDVSFRCPKCAAAYSAKLAARKATILANRKRKAAVRAKPTRTDAEIKWREYVTRITLTAVKLGFLPDPVDCACVDCGRNAECFDHRDYSKPLAVEPVCLACNSGRYRGEMPEPRTSSDFRLTQKGVGLVAFRNETRKAK